MRRSLTSTQAAKPVEVRRGLGFDLEDVLGAEPRDQPGRRVEGDHLAAIDDRDAVAEALRLLHVVRRQQHGAAARLHVAR